jgi:tetratricopeptide (TPR) repeat protein
MLEIQPDDQNQDAYDDLLTAIETSGEQLALLIAVCDDPMQRQAIIQRYETELAPAYHTYRLSMARSQPSLKLAITETQSPKTALLASLYAQLGKANSLNELALLYDSQGRYAEAEPLFLRALKILIAQLGAEHPNTKAILDNLKKFLRQVIAADRTAELSDDPQTQKLLQQLQIEAE